MGIKSRWEKYQGMKEGPRFLIAFAVLICVGALILGTVLLFRGPINDYFENSKVSSLEELYGEWRAAFRDYMDGDLDKYSDMDNAACAIDDLYPNENLLTPIRGAGSSEPKFLIDSTKIEQIID